MNPRIFFIIAVSASLSALLTFAFANTRTDDSPEAAQRTSGQNYKDMALSFCIATAYQKDISTASDAGSSYGALREWTYYDMQNSLEEMQALVNKYLQRDYHNPMAEAEHRDIKFNLLKCLDLYHSKELEAQVKRFVLRPNRTYPPKP